MQRFIVDSATVEQSGRGVLSEYVDAFALAFQEQGYAKGTACTHLRLLIDFSRWVEQGGLGVHDVGPAVWKSYLHSRHQRYQPRKDEDCVFRRLLKLIEPRSPQHVGAGLTAIQCAVLEFQCYLEQERGLSAATVANYSPFIEQFLDQRFDPNGVDLGQLCPTDVIAFVQRHARSLSPVRAKLLVTALRTFLRYLRFRGAIGTDLAACVPTVANWSLSGVPKFLPANEVQRVLDHCDRQTPHGRRDYAILLLLARLGLRAGEIVALTLDDIDWDTGLLTIRGKRKSWAQLPLPAEVGGAIVEYLREGRPASTSRRLFLRQKAPLVGFANSIAICSLVERALTRAGVVSVRKGAHLFRHGLATAMLNGGASLVEIGQLLRHQHPDTTAIYAKVNLPALRPLALPWPGGVQ